MNLRAGWFRPDKHYIEHDSHNARITRAGREGSPKYTVFIKSIDDWHRPYEGFFTSRDEAMDAAEEQLEIKHG